MENIKPDYVTLEVAKLLKEKGFNCKTYKEYTPLFDFITDTDRSSNCVIGGKCVMKYAADDSFSAPEIWQVLKWLHLKHSIFIGLELVDNTIEFYFQPTIWTMKDRDYHNEDMVDQAKSICKWREWKYNTPEEAYLEAIKHCLTNLI